METDELALTVREHGWRLDSLDRAREALEKRVGICEAGYTDMVNEKQIADAVAVRLRKERQFQLTFAQKLGGIVVIAISLAGSIHGFLS